MRALIIGTLLTLLTVAANAQPQMIIRPDQSERDMKLMIRGEQAVTDFRIVEARLLFRLPAMDGQMAAARRLAELYNPAWLAQDGIREWSVLGDPVAAYAWYERAAELGDTRAGNLYVEAIKEAQK